MIALEVISYCFLIAGALFSIIGGIGLVRLPEFYSRMHGGGITDTMGAGLVIVGLILLAGPTLAAFKLFVILFFLTITTPSSSHALAKSALSKGLQPELDVESEVELPMLGEGIRQ
ncbi:monovalent cation/H(+) antiporter subunit G [Allorhodopirellula solitaria]|uniref:Na(+)/H(+) antiporter subunit G1 n=1 Tax=Allorhodopirellula solitaria TaxID=2527987 RepID=A0A5C5XTP9_9BACT|nr:monovalent cation/H(+) antiporter subunit G [Allorhodopirellula solitaria]TWT66587.1 Na(+)/H(+) antiporter subunit G1 [Allorhodopirellula solitaria]